MGIIRLGSSTVTSCKFITTNQRTCLTTSALAVIRKSFWSAWGHIAETSALAVIGKSFWSAWGHIDDDCSLINWGSGWRVESRWCCGLLAYVWGCGWWLYGGGEDRFMLFILDWSKTAHETYIYDISNVLNTFELL